MYWRKIRSTRSAISGYPNYIQWSIIVYARTGYGIDYVANERKVIFSVHGCGICHPKRIAFSNKVVEIFKKPVNDHKEFQNCLNLKISNTNIIL